MIEIGEIEAFLIANGDNKITASTAINTDSGFEFPSIVTPPELEVAFNFTGDAIQFTEEDGRSATSTTIPINDGIYQLETEIALVDDLPRQLTGGVNVVVQAPSILEKEVYQKSKDLVVKRDNDGPPPEDDNGDGVFPIYGISRRDAALGTGALIALAGFAGGN